MGGQQSAAAACARRYAAGAASGSGRSLVPGRLNSTAKRICGDRVVCRQSAGDGAREAGVNRARASFFGGGATGRTRQG